MSTGKKKRFLTDADRSRGTTEVAKTLYKIPTLLTTWTRCGKANCRCAAGRLHGPYHALHWREGTVQRRRYVRAADVPAVRAILADRRALRWREQREHALALMTWRHLGREIAAGEERPRAWEDA